MERMERPYQTGLGTPQPVLYGLCRALPRTRSGVSLESRGTEDRKGVHGVFGVFVLSPTLHKLENDLCRAMAKREKIPLVPRCQNLGGSGTVLPWCGRLRSGIDEATNSPALPDGLARGITGQNHQQ